MNRVPAILSAVLLIPPFLWAKDPTGSTQGAPTGAPIVVDENDDPFADIERVDKINRYLHGEVPDDVNVDQAYKLIMKEIDALSDPELRPPLVERLRKTFGQDQGGSGGPQGGTAKPGDAQFPGEMAWRMRAGMIPRIINDDPLNPAAWSESGHYNCARRDYRQCLSDLDRAIALGSKDPETYAAYGGAAHNLGDYRLALQASAKALQMDPNNNAAHAVYKLSENRAPTVNLPSALNASGALGGPAMQAPTAAVSAAGAPGQAPGAMGAASAPAQVQSAPPPGMVSEEAMQRSATFTGQSAAALAVRDFTLAHETASRAIQLNNRNAQAWNYRAIANNKMSRFKDAVYDASYALSLAPGSRAALQTRSWALNKEGRYKEALADANFTLERTPDNAFAFQNRAFALAGMGDRAGMLESLRRSAELDPRFNGRYEAAVQMPEDGDILYLFDEGSSSAEVAPAPSPRSRKKRFVTLTTAVLSGGFLMALGLLHIFSPTWREKVRSTVRRVLGGPATVALSGASVDQSDSCAVTGFWSQYRLIREVGIGGMGVVYEGVDSALDRQVAVKKMRDEIRLDRRERERFLQEARTVASMRHPNIVEIYSIVEDGGEVYLVFEFAKGENLSDRLESVGTLSFASALKILKDACDAVGYAHRHKVIHRDIKPSNIMVTDEGGAKVMDFGVARQAKDAATRTRTNTVVGTPPYMAPEAEQGTVRPESDVYGLGVMFYEMLSGKLPFAGHGAGMLLNKLNGKFTPLSETAKEPLPPGIDKVMAKVLCPDPDKRYHTAVEFYSAVQGLTA